MHRDLQAGMESWESLWLCCSCTLSWSLVGLWKMRNGGRMALFVLSFHESCPVIHCWGLSPFCEWGSDQGHWPQAKEEVAAVSAFLDVVILLFFLKLNYSCWMRNIDLLVSWEKFEWMTHKSSELREEWRRAQALPWWRQRELCREVRQGTGELLGCPTARERAPASATPWLGSTAPLSLSDQ